MTGLKVNHVSKMATPVNNKKPNTPHYWPFRRGIHPGPVDSFLTNSQ